VVLVDCAGRGDPVQFLLDRSKGRLGRIDVSVVNGLKEVLGAILDDALTPSIAGAAMLVLTDLLLACGGIGHGVDSKRTLTLGGGVEANRGVSQDRWGKSTEP